MIESYQDEGNEKRKRKYYKITAKDELFMEEKRMNGVHSILQ